MNLIKLFYKDKKSNISNLRATNIPEGYSLLSNCGYDEKVEFVLRKLIYQKGVDPKRIDVVLGEKIGLEIYNGNKKLKNSDELAKSNYVVLLKE